MDCVGDKVYSVTVFHPSKVYIFTYNVFSLVVHMSFRTHIFVGEYCVQDFVFLQTFQTPRSLMRGSDGPAGPLCSSNLSR